MVDILVIGSPGLNPARLPLPKEKNIKIIVVDSKNSERVEVNSTKQNHSINPFLNGPEYPISNQRSNQNSRSNQRSNQKLNKKHKKNNNNYESNKNKKEKSRRFTIGGKKNKTKKNRQ
jgi:hypothetical protein